MAAKLGKEGGNFTTSGTGADDGDDFGETADFDGGFGGEVWGGVETGDFVSTKMRACGDNEISGGKLFVLDCDSMWVEKIGVAIKTNNA